MASDDQILAMHSPRHLENMDAIYKMDMEELKRQHVYVNEHSDEAIRRAVGGTLNLTKAVLEGKLQNGMAFVRPPGHHAGLSSFQQWDFLSDFEAKKPDEPHWGEPKRHL